MRSIFNKICLCMILLQFQVSESHKVTNCESDADCHSSSESIESKRFCLENQFSSIGVCTSAERKHATAQGFSVSTPQLQVIHTPEETKTLWAHSLGCLKHKKKHDVRKFSGSYVVPYVRGSYWKQFGSGLCKWVEVVADSEDSFHYYGGYYGIEEEKLYRLTGTLSYNYEEKVYHVQEHFITTNSTNVFSVVPCIVSEDTLMFYIPMLKGNNTCDSQTYVFSRNYATANNDEHKLKKCYEKFQVPKEQLPIYVDGCTDMGLFDGKKHDNLESFSDEDSSSSFSSEDLHF